MSSSLCTTETLLAVAGEDAGLAMPPTGPTLDAPEPTLLWCESVWSAIVVHLFAGESPPPIGEDVDACWCVSNALNCKQTHNFNSAMLLYFINPVGQWLIIYNIKRQEVPLNVTAGRPWSSYDLYVVFGRWKAVLKIHVLRTFQILNSFGTRIRNTSYLGSNANSVLQNTDLVNHLFYILYK